MQYPYLKAITRFSTTTNSISCDLDTLIYDQTSNNQLLFVSLVGVPIGVKKTMQDIRSYYGEIQLRDKKNLDWALSLSKNACASGENPWKSYFLKDALCVNDKTYANAIMYDKPLLEGVIVNWHNKDRFDLTVEWLLKKYSFPMTKDVLLEIDRNHSIFTELKVISKSFPGLSAFKPDFNKIKKALTSLRTGVVDTLAVNWDEIKTVDDYILRFLDGITEKLKPKINTLLDVNHISPYIFEGKYRPFPGQIAPVQASLEVLKKDRFLYLSAEQGCGKTVMTQYIAHAYFKTIGVENPIIFILAPATTLVQWKEEVEMHFPKKANVHIIKKTVDFIKLHQQTKFQIDKPTFIISGKETFKLSYAERPAYIEKVRLSGKRKQLVCPSCDNPLTSPSGEYLTISDFEDAKGRFKKLKSNKYCGHCGDYLWCATYTKTKKTSLIDYIKRSKIKFSLTICDEAQESNNGNSIIGSAVRTLLRKHTKKSILLSGTPNNGYSSSLYNTLFSLMPRALKEDNIHSLQDFVAKYGTLKAVVKRYDDNVKQYGRAEIKESDYRETEGINSAVFVKFLAQNFVYVELEDLSDSLPTLTETYVEIPVEETLRSDTNHFFSNVQRISRYKAAMIKDSVIKHYLNNPYGWSGVSVTDQEGSAQVVEPTNRDENELSAKESKLVELIKDQKEKGRKVCVYVDFTNGGNYMLGTPLPARLKNILAKHGIKSFVLKSGDTVGRKAFIQKHSATHDVMICNRKLVSVGLNLQQFPTYVNYTPSFRVNDVEQANRRGWRINSTKANEIYHFYYDIPFEKDVIERYQTKKAESAAIQGRFNVTLQSDSLRTSSAFGSRIVGQVKNVDNSDRHIELNAIPNPVVEQVFATQTVFDLQKPASKKVVQFETVQYESFTKRVKKKVVENQFSLFG